MPDITLDSTPFTTLALCDCGWRELAGTRAGAWRCAAGHLKSVHNDLQAARTALKAHYECTRRARSTTHPRQAGSKRAGRPPTKK